MPFSYQDTPQVPGGPSSDPLAEQNNILAVDQRRGGMGGLVQVPVAKNTGLEPVTVNDNPGHFEYQEQQTPSYNPDEMFAAYPPQVRDGLSNIMDAGIGAWHHLAQFTSLPLAGLLNASNQVAQDLGTNGFLHGSLANGGWDNKDAEDYVQQTLAKAGVVSDPKKAYQRWAASMGEDAASLATQAMMFLGGAGPAAKAGDSLLASAPSETDMMANEALAAQSPDILARPMATAARTLSEGKQAVGATMKNVGETAIASPGQVVSSYVGAGLGQGLGDKLGQKDSSFQKMMANLGITAGSDAWSTALSMVGGMFGSGVGSMRRIRPKDATDYEGNLGEAGFRGRPVSGGAQVRSLFDGPALLNAQREFSGQDVSDAVNGYTSHVTNWLKDAAARVVGLHANEDGSMPTMPSTTAQAQKLRETALSGYNKAQSIADNNFWNQVDKTPRATIPTAMSTAQKMASSETSPTVIQDTIPMNYIKDVIALGKGGKMPNIGQMQSLIGAMRRRATSLGVEGDPATRPMRANLTQLANSLDEDMGNAAPDSYPLQQARAFSNWIHQTFTNGPLGTFTNAMNSQTLSQVNAKDALTNAMGDYRFGPQLAGQTPEQLGPQGVLAQPKPGTVGPQQPVGLPDLAEPIQPRTGDWLKSMIADTFAQKMDPHAVDGLGNTTQAAAAAMNYMKSEEYRNLVKAFPQLDQEMQGHFNNIQQGAADAMAIGKSVFFKNAGMQPETAVDSLFSSGTKIKDANKIIDRFGENKPVMESLQYALVRKLGNSVSWDPNRMKTMLNSKDNRQLFQTLMPEGGFQRLNKIIQGTIDAGSQSDSIFGKYGPGRLMGRALGTIATGWLGGHSIQIHSIGTNLGGNIVQRLFHIVPPEYMLGKALVDPRWERFLNSQLPTTMQGIRATNRMMGLLVGASSAANRSLMDGSGGDNGSQ